MSYFPSASRQAVLYFAWTIIPLSSFAALICFALGFNQSICRCRPADSKHKAHVGFKVSSRPGNLVNRTRDMLSIRLFAQQCKLIFIPRIKQNYSKRSCLHHATFSGSVVQVICALSVFSEQPVPHLHDYLQTNSGQDHCLIYFYL